jgi:DNA-binding winged helix-turn-helix (wHTH) protein
MDQPTAHLVYEFADFQVDPTQRLLLLRSGGRPLPLSPRAFDALVYFLEHRGQLLEKSTLMDAIWPTVVVEQNNLNQHISALRRVLGESRDDHRFIVTVPGRGYRFVADVTVVDLSKPPDENLSATAPNTLAEPSVTPAGKAPAAREVSKAKPWLSYRGVGAATALLLAVVIMWSLRPRNPS